MSAADRAARVLLTGWFSFRQGEVTAGDVLALEAASSALDAAGVPCDTAWSEVFRPGFLRLADADPGRYSHLVFVCGPLHGEQVTGLHRRFAGCTRIAAGVSVIDPADPAVTGFDLVLARDDGSSPPRRDLATAAVSVILARPPLPVTGLILAAGQGEYGGRRRHDDVASQVTSWLNATECAPVVLDTRLDTRDGRLCATAEAFMSVLVRLDIVVTTRLHGLALALSAGVPALAVDPVAGGGKVTAQARAWDWPGLLPAQLATDQRRLDDLWGWCLSPAGRQAAKDASARPDHDLRAQLDALVTAVRRET